MALFKMFEGYMITRLVKFDPRIHMQGCVKRRRGGRDSKTKRDKENLNFVGSANVPSLVTTKQQQKELPDFDDILSNALNLQICEKKVYRVSKNQLKVCVQKLTAQRLSTLFPA